MFLGFSIFVRNEIQALPGLIDNIMGHFDYYVVVDTGSDDGTWEYLKGRERDLHIYRLGIPFDAEHFSFGHVRSAAAHLNKAKWVMMLDADERMDPTDLQQLRAEAQLAETGGLWCTAFPRHRWLDTPEEKKTEDKGPYPDLQARLILNDGNVWWRRPVHEVVMVDGVMPRFRTSTIHIDHFHDHFRSLREDPGSFHHVYERLKQSDPEWADTY